MKGLRTTMYRVANMQDGKAWYSKVFGEAPYFEAPSYIGFNIEGYELGIIPDENPELTKTTNVISYWGVDNVEEEFKRLLALGASVYEKPQDVGGDIIVATVKDPWDNVLGIIYNPSFKE